MRYELQPLPSPKPSFTPFSITLTFDKEDEALLFWHVMNRGQLRDAIFSKPYYGGSYNKDKVAPQFNGVLWHELKRFVDPN